MGTSCRVTPVSCCRTVHKPCRQSGRDSHAETRGTCCSLLILACSACSSFCLAYGCRSDQARDMPSSLHIKGQDRACHAALCTCGLCIGPDTQMTFESVRRGTMGDAGSSRHKYTAQTENATEGTGRKEKGKQDRKNVCKAYREQLCEEGFIARHGRFDASRC